MAKAKHLAEATSSLKIALIDDDVVMLSLMCAQFKKMGPQNEVCTFRGGPEFLSSDLSVHWDIIVVDHLMPSMSGTELITVVAPTKTAG